MEKITLSTTPFYHPITPLLLDINSAKEAKESVDIPTIKNSFSNYAELNTTMAIEYFEKKFGKKPKGFWPAEGSVSQKTAELFAKNGVKWFCSDEEILFKTLHDTDKKNIYKNYQLNLTTHTIDIRFRDHYLSDAIGFEYSTYEPQKAAKEFVANLKKIYDGSDFTPLVNVILDGENAWEFYPNNAMDFFFALYSEIENTTWIECISMDGVSDDKEIEHQRLNSLATGSWINGNFDIWIGSRDKNSAWSLLDATYTEFIKHKKELDEITLQKIEKEFLVALGSDWFWWYGDDHYTIQKEQFDSLFRKHLINIYSYIGLDVPDILYIPIIKPQKNHDFHITPKEYMAKHINSENYFKWLKCGMVELTKELGAMDGVKRVVKKLYYGYNKESISFLLLGDGLDKYDLSIKLNDNAYPLDTAYDFLEVYTNKDGLELKILRDKVEIQDRFKFSFKIKYGGMSIQRFPLYDDFIIDFEKLELTNWYV